MQTNWLGKQVIGVGGVAAVPLREFDVAQQQVGFSKFELAVILLFLLQHIFKAVPRYHAADMSFLCQSEIQTLAPFTQRSCIIKAAAVHQFSTVGHSHRSK